MAEYTPMMQQYLKTKDEYPDCVLFYRLGDFYEMFFEDAINVSRELELTLTGKNCGMEERAPMCGVPFHALDTYLPRLVEKGYKVAICEQVEDPKQAKGIVKREVTRIVTPGTNMSAAMNNTDNIYIAGVICVGDTYGYAVSDVSTGEFFMSEYSSFDRLSEDIQKRIPKELICNRSFFIRNSDWQDRLKNMGISVSIISDEILNTQRGKDDFNKQFSEDIGKYKHFSVGLTAARELYNYLLDTQMTDLSHIIHLQISDSESYMGIDGFSFRNLELIETMREKERRGSLLWVLDKTKTAMGARLLKTYIRSPLRDITAINKRLDAVEELKDNMILREEIREYLDCVYDIERLLTRISYRSAGPRDLLAFRDSIAHLPAIKLLVSDTQSLLLNQLACDMDTLDDIHELLLNAINEDAPVGIHDGDIIKSGYVEEIDHLKKARTDGKKWLAGLEEKERDETGIKNLKIKYNRVFGYYIEVTNSYLELTPDYYIRKQTLANCERFFTPELKELEDTILGAQDKLLRLETDVFKDILETIAKEIPRIQRTAHVLAVLDVLLSLGVVASKNNYVRPKLNDEGRINIKDGRHPVVEQMMPHNDFISNDTYLDNEDNRLIILTGPNMAGKSTYMRQSALIVLMAQMGCFVPAKEADIAVVDRIFTRVGASDDLSSGQSTFMVEMYEMSNILKNAGKNSLIILDEIGRGTSTFDGLSIAWAIAEYINDKSKIGAKTMFATHYHEMTELEGQLSGIKNYSIAVREKGDDIIFLRKIIPQGADKSYGIQVAKLAGLPKDVIERAKDILEEIISRDSNSIKLTASDNMPVDNEQLSFFDQRADILSEIKSVDVLSMTPMEAMNYLYDLQKRVLENE